MERARRTLRMSDVLRAGGFESEAIPPLRDAVELALSAAAVGTGLLDGEDDGPVPESVLLGGLLARSLLTTAAVDLVRSMRSNTAAEAVAGAVSARFAAAHDLIDHLRRSQAL